MANEVDRVAPWTFNSAWKNPPVHNVKYTAQDNHAKWNHGPVADLRSIGREVRGGTAVPAWPGHAPNGTSGVRGVGGAGVK